MTPRRGRLLIPPSTPLRRHRDRITMPPPPPEQPVRVPIADAHSELDLTVQERAAHYRQHRLGSTLVWGDQASGAYWHRPRARWGPGWAARRRRIDGGLSLHWERDRPIPGADWQVVAAAVVHPGHPVELGADGVWRTTTTTTVRPTPRSLAVAWLVVAGLLGLLSTVIAALVDPPGHWGLWAVTMSAGTAMSVIAVYLLHRPAPREHPHTE